MQRYNRLNYRCVGLLLAAVLSGSGYAKDPLTAHVSMVNAEGREIGTATLTETALGVLIDAQIEGLTPGEHGFHLHETGQCGTPDFKSAGGHYNPSEADHGYLHGDTVHAGDMPNQFVGDDGRLRAHVLNTQVTLGDTDGGLFDADGSALMVHSGPDDYRSQPAGAAGKRVACGVIEKS